MSMAWQWIECDGTEHEINRYKINQGKINKIKSTTFKNFSFFLNFMVDFLPGLISFANPNVTANIPIPVMHRYQHAFLYNLGP